MKLRHYGEKKLRNYPIQTVTKERTTVPQDQWQQQTQHLNVLMLIEGHEGHGDEEEQELIPLFLELNIN